MIAKNKSFIIITCLLLSILISSNALAWGIGTTYSDNHPLKVYPGDTREVYFLLRGDSDKDNIVDVIITQGGDISKLDYEREYLIPKNSGTYINITLEIPQDMEAGTIRKIEIKATSKEAGTGTLGLRKSIRKSFPVEIVERPKREIGLIWLGLILLMVLGVAIAIIKRKDVKKFLKIK